MAVEVKRGISKLEQLCKELTKEDLAKQQRKEQKKLKRKKRKERKAGLESKSIEVVKAICYYCFCGLLPLCELSVCHENVSQLILNKGMISNSGTPCLVP